MVEDFCAGFIIMRMDKKNFIVVQIIIMLSIVAVVIGVYSTVIKNKTPLMNEGVENSSTTSTNSISTSTAKTAVMSATPSAWKIYTNEKYGFSFQYPSLSKISIASSSSSVGVTILVKLSDASTSYVGNGRTVAVQVYAKGSFIQYSEASKCTSFIHSELLIDGKIMDIAEHEKCNGESGIISSTHYTHAVISLSDKEDIVFTANLGSLLFGKSDFVSVILKTFRFIPKT